MSELVELALKVVRKLAAEGKACVDTMEGELPPEVEERIKKALEEE